MSNKITLARSPSEIPLPAGTLFKEQDEVFMMTDEHRDAEDIWIAIELASGILINFPEGATVDLVEGLVTIENLAEADDDE